jgi:UDP-N-acetylmuramoyl-tripeptide--D-alanyl-D-alanine ligase
VPLTLLRLRASHQVAVVELGMNHPGEIALLAGMARPTVALVNNAQREHLEFMATVEAVARENGAVIESLGPTGIAVFPSGDVFTPLWTALCGARHHFTFSDAIMGPTADVRGQGDWRDGAWSVRAATPVGDVSFTLRIAGRHNVRNALAAVASGLAAGAPLEAVRQGLDTFQPVKGRSRAFGISLGGRTIAVVDDTYNANPDSVRAALDVLAELPPPRLLVLGDMGEVGDQGPVFHAEAGDHAREQGVEQVFTLGTLSQHVASGFAGARHFGDIDTLIAEVLSVLPEVGSVVVKGSRFMRMERVVDAIAQGANVHHEGSAHAA